MTQSILSAADVIRLLGLVPHPEGGHYRETFRDKPGDFDPRTPGKPFMAAYAEYIIHKNKQLGSAGELENVRASLGVKA